MPRKIRRTRRIEGPSERLFLHGNGCWSYFDEPLHPDLASARRHWITTRRDVWVIAKRFSPPRAAEIFDGLSRSGLELLQHSWGLRRGYSLEEIRAALEADRRAVEQFRAADPAGAADVEDFLSLWLEDLRAVEAEAVRCAADHAAGHCNLVRPELASSEYFGEALEVL